ncbi:mannosylphosphorylation protein [Podospora fimiseda]|uniref:Mannosylphosphorylation protein n=1 Tax=Podospora fimiseda TaxID=252190 RepID=A0AAN7H6I2_9PEZI|nr:mannosylphosphorylation protein [Podospora fimiseda]
MQPSVSLLFCLSAAATAATSLKSPSLVVQNEKELEQAAAINQVTPARYFRHDSFHTRYDSRFAEKQLGYDEQIWALKNLTRHYLATLNSIGIETWLMHNTLLGWWWGKQVLPWEPSLNVQVSEPGIFFLAKYHNMSVHQFRIPATRQRRYYLLDISPVYNVREPAAESDTVDARWIDMESGLFIDINVVRYNLTHPEGKGMMSCKDGSAVKDTFLFPLRDTTFEGVPAKIPYRYRELLAAEYGVDALIKGDRENHLYSNDQSEWVRKEKKDL